MSDLRAKLVEAMARAIHGVAYPNSTFEFSPGVEDEFRAEAEAALDAALDTLTENAEEWRKASWTHVGHSVGFGPFAGALIAALRVPEGET